MGENLKERRSSGKGEVVSIWLRVAHIGLIIFELLKDNWF